MANVSTAAARTRLATAQWSLQKLPQAAAAVNRDHPDLLAHLVMMVRLDKMDVTDKTVLMDVTDKSSNPPFPMSHA